MLLLYTVHLCIGLHHRKAATEFSMFGGVEVQIVPSIASVRYITSEQTPIILCFGWHSCDHNGRKTKGILVLLSASFKFPVYRPAT